MAGLNLVLKANPGEPLDFGSLTAMLIAGPSTALSAAVVGTTRRGVRLGDVFRVQATAGDEIVIEPGNATIDGIGTGLAGGRIVVAGNAGNRTGRGMRGGRIEIRGSAGRHLGTGMRGGLIHVAGSAADGAGGLSPGLRFGMTGGTIVIEGDAGARAGEKMRRGLILVRGSSAGLTGARMVGGTIVVEGRLGAETGRLMRRGTVIAAAGDIPDGFTDCGVHELVILRIMTRDWARTLGPLAPRGVPIKVRRYAGDLSTIGKGELLMPA